MRRLLALAIVLFSARSASAQPPSAPAEAPSSEPAPPAPAPAPVPASDEKPAPSANDPAPLGHAAPPTEAATRGPAVGPVKAGLEIFAQYSYRNFQAGDNHTWFHQFDVPRVHGALEGTWEDARGRLVLEATRSASDGALIGVSGDSLVLRVREAYAAYRIVPGLEASAGVIPTLTVPEVDGTWMMRAVAPSALETSGLLTPADLGAKVRFDDPHGYGWVATAAYNGEGYTSRELNRGKTVEIAGEVHPIQIDEAKALGVFASYVNGSTGASLARANRLTGGLVWQGSRVRAGAMFTHGWGVGQLGTQRAIAFSTFARVEPIPRFLLGARFDYVVRAVGDPTDTQSTLWATVGYRVALPLETFLALSRAIPSTRAEAEVPGSDGWELRLIARVVF